MNVKNVIANSAKLLELYDVVEYLNSEENDENEEVETLLLATNMAINNVASNYINVCNKKTVESDTGIVDFSDISDSPIIQIKKVLRKNMPIRFRVHSDSIEVEKGQCEIVFSYFPPSVKLSDNFSYFPTLNELLFSYAVVSEYLFLKGQIDDAYMWDKRFKASLLSIQRPCRNIILPKKRWW